LNQKPSLSICTQLQSDCTTFDSTFIVTYISSKISTHKGEAIEVKWRRSRLNEQLTIGLVLT